MIEGVILKDTSSVVSVNDIAFAYIRGRKLDKDDQKFSQHRDLLNQAGKPYGVYIDLDYRLSGASGAAQAKELYDKDRGFCALNPIIRVAPLEGFPITSFKELATRLHEVIYYAKTVYLKRPVGIATNLSIFKAILPYLTQEIASCWFDYIAYSTNPPQVIDPFQKMVYWEKTDFNQTLKGMANVAKIYWPGTMESMLAWHKNTSLPIPSFEATPPDNPPVNDVPDGNLEELLKQLILLEKERNVELKKLTSLMENFYGSATETHSG